MIQWAIIATLVGAGSIFGFIRTLQAKHKQASEYEARLDDLRSALLGEKRENEKLRHVIQAQEEATHNANKAKREIREHADPGDRARAATDLMRELSRDGDSDGDGSTSSD